MAAWAPTARSAGKHEILSADAPQSKKTSQSLSLTFQSRWNHAGMVIGHPYRVSPGNT